MSSSWWKTNTVATPTSPPVTLSGGRNLRPSQRCHALPPRRASARLPSLGSSSVVPSSWSALFAYRLRPHRPRRRRRRRARRPVGGAAARRRRPRGHRARARGRPRRPRRPARARRLLVRHRPDRADHARPDRRRAGRASARRARGLADLRRLDPAYRAHFADGSTLDVRADVDAMADEIAAGLRARRGRRLPPLRRLRDRRSTTLEMRTSSTATSTRRSTWSARRWPGSPRSAASAGSRRRSASYLNDERTAADFFVPGDVRRTLAVRRARDLRRHRLHGHRRRRLLPGRRHARGARGAGRRGREARRRPSATAPTSPASSCPATARSRCTPPTASGSRATRGRSPPTCRSPTATLLPPEVTPRRAVAAASTRRPASCCSPGRRAVVLEDAHHNIHFGEAWRSVVRRAHRRRVADDRPVVPGDARRPCPTRRSRPAGEHVYYVLVPDAQPRRADRLGRRSGRATATRCVGRARAARATPASATRSRSST